MPLLNELRRLRDHPRKINKAWGICCNLLEGHTEFSELVKRWPKHSGRSSYPIPHSKYPGHPDMGYARARHKWDRRTAYGKFRWELLNWAIATLEQREKEV